jgi:UDP-N-acetylglucosamine 2-epimerase (non-hydrolysing)
MRTHTERREGVVAGFANLAGQSVDSIETAVIGWLDQSERMCQLKNRPNPYGDGHAAERVVAALTGKKIQEFNG